MKPNLFFLSLVLLCCGSVSASWDPHELKSLLNAISTLQANFSQTIQTEDGRVVDHVSGKMWLKKPAQFRWEILGEDPRLIVSNGEKVWDFDEGLEQVTVQKIDQNQIQAPIFFLSGDLSALDRDFSVLALSSEDGFCLKDSEQCFQLTPKEEEGAFQWIKIGFSGKELREMEMLDQLGQRSIFSFSKVKLNQQLDPVSFEFTPPENADVLMGN